MSGLQGRSKSRRWLYNGLAVAWAIAVLAGVVWQVRPPGGGEPPSGWKHYKGIGSILAIVIGQDEVLAGGSGGLFRIPFRGVPEPVGIAGLKNSVLVYALLREEDGTTWVGHDRGVSILRGSSWKTLTHEDGLPEAAVRAIVKTSSGDVWLGTTIGAVLMQRSSPSGPPVRVEAATAGVPLHMLVSAVQEDGEGGVWFGTYGHPSGGLTRFAGSQLRKWQPRDGLPHAYVNALMIDREGRLWAGCGFMDQGGAAIFESRLAGWELVAHVPAAGLAGPKVRSVFQDSRGRVWLGSENDGVAVRLGDQTLRVLTVDHGLSAQEILVIREGPEGDMWLGTIDGLTRIGPAALSVLFSS